MKAYLIAAPSMTDGMERFLAARSLAWVNDDMAGDSERLVEAAGRVCYMSFGSRQFRTSNRAYIMNLIRQAHDSVLEHANFTLLADGLSRSLTHQLVRHRIGFSYSQLSQQYHDESDIEFVEPLGLSQRPTSQRRWTEFMSQCRSLYRELITDLEKEFVASALADKERTRLIRSIARSVLPSAANTTLVVTGNARAWRHLLSVRGSVPGDLEMRRYCISVFEVLSSAAPNLFADFELADDAFGGMIQRRSGESSIGPAQP
nr:FAD-dependent thymidylate synthase [Nitrosomonas nitrosa]